MTGQRGRYPRKTRQQICDHCRHSFDSRSPWGRFCSKACKQAAYRERKAAAKLENVKGSKK